MIRKAKEGDFQEVFELHKEMILKLVKLNPKRFKLKKDEKKKFKKYFDNNIKDKSKVIYVSDLNGKVVGYASARIDESVSFETYENHGWVSEVSVSKDFQNQGIGRKLMDAVIKFFRKKKVGPVYFLVETNNFQSIKAWEKMGFKKELYMFHKMLN